MMYVVLGKDRLGAWTVMQPPTDSPSEAAIVYNAWVETKGNGLKDEVVMLGGRPRRWKRPRTAWEVHVAKVTQRLSDDKG